MFSRAPIAVPIHSFVSGDAYTLTAARGVRDDAATLSHLTSICNEAAIYHWLFRDLLRGRLYAPEDARHWLSWAAEGWAAGTHFVFIVTDSAGRIAAACDIKSNAPVAEIGYWASEHHRGVMTNAVLALADLARGAAFEGLFARTKPGNARSAAVLRRAGFSPTGTGPDGFDRFERSLRP